MELFFLFMLVALMIAALGSGYPVAFALPGASILTIFAAGLSGWLFEGSTDAFFAQGGPSQWLSAGVTNLRGVYWEPERDTLIAIPLFIFMGIMLQRSKIAEDLLVTMARLFGPVPGGLGISVVFVGALLAATTGIVGATVVAMGLISLPAMMRNNYSQPLATGTIVASGTLGQIIPPSIVLIILADQLSSAADQGGTIRKELYRENTGELTMPSLFDVSSTSAGEMFLGAILPGLVLVGLYMVYIFVYALIWPDSAPPLKREVREKGNAILSALGSLLPPLLLIFLVLGSIIMGVATVNQAGAIGAAGALVMAGYRLKQGQSRQYWPAILTLGSLAVVAFIVANYDTNIRSIDSADERFAVTVASIATVGLVLGLIWSGIRTYKIDNALQGVMIETAKATSLVFIILLGAAILTAAFRAFGGEELVRHFLEGLPGGFWFKFFVVMAVIFFLGFFLDFIEIAVVVVPIVAPILLADPDANISAVWLGVMIGLNIQTSFLTPPFGFALFYLRGIAPKAVKTINIYKGVVPFITLQLIALVIVAWAPPLVNYLPNRISLLSENAPPPRNPRLSYCVDGYIDGYVTENGTLLLERADAILAADLGTLPERLAEDLQEALEGASEAIALHGEVLAAAAAVEAASVEYRPLHVRVRAIERDIRRAETRIEEQRGRETPDEAEIAELEAEIEALRAAVPADWEERREAFLALKREETNARRAFTRAGVEAYETPAEVLAVLRATPALERLEPNLRAMAERVATEEEASLVDPLAALADRFEEVAGAGDIDDAISDARRALRGDEPDREEAMELMAEAIALLEAEKAWRPEAVEALRNEVADYNIVARRAFGLREQANFTEDQALDIAGCLANHRSLALEF